MEELRQHLSSARPPDTQEAAHEMVAAQEAAFSSWDEDILGALMVNVGMILGTRRGIEGAAALTRALEALGVLLAHREEVRRKMN